jgi:UDP-glucose 4-epimerase
MGLSTISHRFFNVYGPRQSADGADSWVIPIFSRVLKNKETPTIYGTGLQTRDFIHVSDVVRAMILAALADVPSEPILNIGTGHSETILKVLELLRERFPGSPEPILAPPRAGDPVISRAIVDKARDILGFEAKIGLIEGLKSLS